MPSLYRRVPHPRGLFGGGGAELEAIIGPDLSLQIYFVVVKMIEREEYWRAISFFCCRVMRKEEAERVQ